MTAPTAQKVSRGIDVRLESDYRFDSSNKERNVARSKHGEESDAVLRSSRRSALLSAGICLLLAGLTTGCERADAGNQIGVVEAALVPPPPVNQNIGIYDRTFTGFEATTCLGCHDPSTTDPTTVSDKIALRHHMMLDPSSPRYKPQYYCMDCHQPDGTGAMSVTLNCPTCHTSTPHHKSVPAQARHCAACHGSVINNFDDGHYIPTYAKSIVTPDPNCRVWKDAGHTTCAAGGCRTCHVASNAITPNTWNNDQTHHGTGLGQGGAGSANPPEQCGWCHNIASVGGVPTPAIDIRTCETCHGPTSLHGIEFQYDTNNGTAGYGHIGADFDCWGCHGFFNRYALPPSFGPTIPTVDNVAPDTMTAEAATSVCIDGQSMINTVVEQNKTYAPVVVVSLLDEARTETPVQVITPTSVTESQVCFTATLPVGLFNLRVFKAYQGSLQVMSNALPIVVVRPKATIESAVVWNGPMITIHIVDPCMLPDPPEGCIIRIPPIHLYKPCFGPGCIWVWVGNQGCDGIKWSNQELVATCPNATIGAKVIVGGPSGLFLRATLADGRK